MLLNKKTVSLVMVFSVILTAVSCRNEEGSGEETGGYEANYYSTRMITIPQDSFVLRSFYDGENVNFISGSIDMDHSDV